MMSKHCCCHCIHYELEFKVSGCARFIGRHVLCKFDYTAYTPNA